MAYCNIQGEDPPRSKPVIEGPQGPKVDSSASP